MSCNFVCLFSNCYSSITFTEKLEFLPKNISFHSSDVWYGESMQHVYWPLVFKEMAPFLSYTDRNILMETSETDGVSPCLLLTAAIYYKSEKRSNFRTFIENISGRVVNAFFNSINRTKRQKEKENDAKRTVSLFVHKYLKQTNEMMFILNSVKTEAEKCRKVYKEKTWPGLISTRSRESLKCNSHIYRAAHGTSQLETKDQLLYQ